MTDVTAEVQKHLVAAMTARQRGQFQDELRSLDRALEVNPLDPVALNARGMRALADNQPEQAAALFEKAAQIDSREPTLWINLASAARAQGDDELERSALERAIEADRFHFIALLRKAELEERTGHAKEAAVGWSAVVQVASSSVDRPPVMDDAIRRGQAYLTAHSAALSGQIEKEFGADRAADPDLRRFNACMAHMLGRRAIYSNECHGLHYPFLPADEFFDKRLFPWLGDIEAHTAAIRAEGLALLEDPGEALRPYVRMDKGLPENKWTELDQSLDWGACFLWEYGEPNQPVLDRCPATAAALQLVPVNRIPGKAPSAFFSILRPGARIPPHTGVTNTRTIIHLPLVVPPGCWFRVGGETREWMEGNAFAFDDTIEHEAHNSSDQIRVVLIFDVWNPHLTTEEQDLLVRFFALQEQD
ncbi:aspartyl/asparaginyl beta-hydroxylase domain-containing protein [Sphingomonas sp. URHD0057]|uniref:aspartyl/asparaginyl beta-hydroxylase domain-containing protein n=1 Tax=Sphingomonas sp. URHD0057 TaxID=1380389 RepID=UPI000490CBC0|nr:aspartyl/asparaginyl beta-hydroxylase domain-containing protein [Sphingomonas sp. URHD0057]